MNENSKILEIKRGENPRIRNSISDNHLNLTIPRRLKFSGHFHLNTLHFRCRILGILAHN